MAGLRSKPGNQLFSRNSLLRGVSRLRLEECESLKLGTGSVLPNLALAEWAEDRRGSRT